MSDNKQKETPNGYDLDGYEQLKRRNRRRLVLASGLVVASGMLFGLALTSGDDKNSPFKEAPVGQSQVKTADEPSKAVVLEPNKEDVAAAEEAARHADAEAPNKPQNAGDEEDNAPIEVLKPNRESAPEDVGEPLVLINDTLDDGNIKGLEESERIQRAEDAKHEAAERRAEERRQRQAEQRAAAARKTQAQQEATEKENALAAKKRALQARAEKAEREAAAERNKLAQLEKAEKAIAERKSAKNSKDSKDSVKDKAEPAKKAEAKVEKPKNEKAKPETAKAEKADKVKTAEKPSEKAKPKAEKEKAEAKPAKKAAIQAGYAEKERAQSLQRKMKAAGIDSTITEVMTDKGKVYRVKSASYKNARDAERDLNKLRVHGIAGQVTSE
ncbi:cell division protein FtsN [Neisseria subflava]|jgi:cell division protein ftsN|uniref:cell division protein FtsN n=2 Tax=Neisseria TaxID=482 RepID=UPI0027E16D95|nr:cell division protein FtsN [Neisseria subflava]